MNNKKAISPVVATALLLVVAVVAVVGFQNWFGTYSSGVFTDTEIKSDSGSGIAIDSLIGNTLYILSSGSENISINSLKIDNDECTITQDLTNGMNQLNVTSCLDNLSTATPDAVLITENKVVEKKLYIKTATLSSSGESGGSGPEIVETSGNFTLLSNGIVDCSGASVGETGTLNSITYTAFTNQNLSDMIGLNNISFYETACTSLVTDMNFADSWDGGVFFNSNINPNISHWDTSSVTDMNQMFRQASNFNQPLNFDTSSVTNMLRMFQGATSFNQPLNFDTSSVTTMNAMFGGATSFNQSVNFDTSSVTDMNSMFYGAASFNQPLNFDTSSVTTMNGMFSGATSFNQPLSFDTSNVTDMGYMFYGATSFNQSLNFNTSNVISINAMFFDATSFNQSLNFDTNNVTDMRFMFRNANSFNQPLNFNTSSVIDIDGIFQDATSFNQDLTGWVVNQVTSCTGFNTSATSWQISNQMDFAGQGSTCTP